MNVWQRMERLRGRAIHRRFARRCRLARELSRTHHRAKSVDIARKFGLPVSLIERDRRKVEANEIYFLVSFDS